MKKTFIIAIIFSQILFGGQVDKLEYFIDTDPGIGNASTLSVTAGSEIDEDLTISLNTVAYGFHQLGLRVHDGSRKWSQTTVYPFYKVPKGENIVKFEYTIQSPDGSAVSGTHSLTSAADVDEDYAIPLPANLSNGFYTLRIRAVDDDGQKSYYTIVPFYKISVPGSNITAAEYFFGADPGVGNGIAVTGMTAGESIDFTFQADISSISDGIYTLRVRVRDDKGNWSIGDCRTFLKETIRGLTITEAEYFIDNDPGEGNAVNLPLTSGETTDAELTVPLTGLGQGIHHISVRVKDNRGKWSLTTARTFVTTELPSSKEVVACEYFIDNDPGEGAATAIAITNGNSVDQSLTVELSGLLPGIHHLGIRTQYANGRWSLATARTFLVNDLSGSQNIVACEYFIDTDPGTGNATDVAITAGVTVEKNIVMDISTGMRPGFHKIGFRVKYDNGRWSATTIRPFVKREIQPKTNITSVDYTITGDESFSTGPFSYTSFTPDTSIDVHFSHDLSALEFGKSYTLHMTAAEANGLNSFQYDHDFTVTIDTEAPAMPADFTAVSGMGKVTLNWTANTEADLAKYKIYRGSLPSPTTLLTTFNYPVAGDTIYVDNTVVSGQTYYYRMVAEDYDFNKSTYTADVSVTPFWGPTWYVATTGNDITGNGSSSNPFATIQNAINKAFETNTVEVAAGTYNEDIDFAGKNLILESANGASATIIEGSGTRSVFSFTNGENANSLVKGFTITGGSSGTGGAVYCNNASSPRFENLIVTGNSGSSGGGFYVRENSNVSLENVVITDNTSSMGGGLYAYNSSVYLQNVVIGNHSGVAIASAMYLNISQATIINSTIAHNSASSQGAIYAVGSTINTIVNSIFWGNSPANIAFSGGGAPSSVNVTYSDFENAESGIVTNENGTVTWGSGNMTVNPGFINVPSNNFALKNSSPCINAGTADTTGLNLPETDAAGNSRIYDGVTDIVDMGAYEVQGEPSMVYVSGDITEDTTWGADTVRVISDITVVDGKTLTIDPGVYVEFQGHFALNVQGRLLAVGTEEDSITFTVNDTTGFSNVNVSDGGWYGIRFYNNTSVTSIIDYCIINRGKATASMGDGNYGGAIYLHDYSLLELKNSSISNNISNQAGGAIYLSNSTVKIERCHFISNYCLDKGGACWFGDNSNFTLKYTSFDRNNANGSGGGIYSQNSTGELENSLIIKA